MVGKRQSSRGQKAHFRKRRSRLEVGMPYGAEVLEQRYLLANDLAPDVYEANETQETATLLGSAISGTLHDLTIHSGDVADIDFYRITATAIGSLTISTQFDVSQGNLDVGIYDGRGHAVAVSSSRGDGTRVVLPAVSHESYWIRVAGVDGATNRYALAWELIPAATPQSVHLDPFFDSGVSNIDGITGKIDPVFVVQADLEALRSQGIPLLSGEQVAAGDAPGVAVVVRISDVASGATVSGYAEAVPEDVSIYRFRTPALGSGSYLVSAAVQVFDLRQTQDGESPLPDPAMGETPMSGGLLVQIDDIPPSVTTPQLLSSSDSGQDHADRVTNIQRPAFFGVSEPNARVRVLAGGLQVGESVAGTDGRWEITVEPLRDGIYALTTVAEDLAGNFGENPTVRLIEIDTLAPNTPFLGLVPPSDPDSDAADDETLTFSMSTTDPNAADHLDPFHLQYRLYVRGVGTAEELIYDSAVDETIPPENRQGGFTDLEEWTATVPGLPDGEYSFKLEVEDRAGNISHDFLLEVTIGPEPVEPPSGEISPGPRIDNVTRWDASFTSLFAPKPATGPDPLIPAIVIHFSDDPLSPEGPAAAVDPQRALEEGNYRLVGDATGNIPITSVEIVGASEGPGRPTTAVGLTFAGPLPDDRYTLSVSDRITDPDGNRLDGESGAAAPFVGNDGANPTVPIFPTGDGFAGGAFLARFTVDSRPEIGVWAGGSVYVDTNGNFVFDQDASDFVNRDLSYTFGYTSDDVFAGNFSGLTGTADGYDKLAAYGYVGSWRDGTFRWLIDTDNDGVVDLRVDDPGMVNGIPVAGNFDGDAANGDEVGLFTGTTWHFDTDHDFRVDLALGSSLRGYPVVGDFNGDGWDDLATWSDDGFAVDLAESATGGWDGQADSRFAFGFIGVRERPVAADMDQDGFEDLGLWVPDRGGMTPRFSAEWYWLLSSGTSILDRVTAVTDTPAAEPTEIRFSPWPLGTDLFAQFGDEFGIPLVGNFDPPSVSAASTVPAVATAARLYTNPRLPLDITGDGAISARDALVTINFLNQYGSVPVSQLGVDDFFLDGNGDGFVSPADVLAVVHYLNDPTSSPDGASAPRATTVDVVYTLAATEDEERDPLEAWWNPDGRELSP